MGYGGHVGVILGIMENQRETTIRGEESQTQTATGTVGQGMVAPDGLEHYQVLLRVQVSNDRYLGFG